AAEARAQLQCRSCRIGRVLVHVRVREVVGQDGRGLGAGVQVDDHVRLPAGEVDQVAVVADAPRATDLHAVEGDIDGVGVELDVRPDGADRGKNAAPVGVLPEERGLDQVVAGDRAADLDGAVLGGGAADLDLDLLGGTFGVGQQLSGQVGAGTGHGRGDLLLAGGG